VGGNARYFCVVRNLSIGILDEFYWRLGKVQVFICNIHHIRENFKRTLMLSEKLSKKLVFPES
jgi:hypothetical protein